MHQGPRARDLGSFGPAPIRPWTYLRLRREAAGLSLVQLAGRLADSADRRGDWLSWLTFLEERGVTATSIGTMRLDRAMPFSAEVYTQLAGPDDRHPRLCHGCGWDQQCDQFDADGHATTWSSEDPALCTRCAPAGQHQERAA